MLNENNITYYERLRRAALSNWIDKNVVMDSGEDVDMRLFEQATMHEDVYDDFVKLDIICRAYNFKHENLAKAAMFWRRRILEKELSSAGIDANPAKIQILEAARILYKDELNRKDATSPDPFWDDFRTPATSYDRDSYDRKIEAAENWDKCCLFIGYRNSINKMALMFLANIAPENCEYVLLIDFTREGISESVEEAIAEGIIETDLDLGCHDGKASLWHVDLAGLRSSACEVLQDYPAARFAARSYVTHEWCSLNEDSYDMIKLEPYPEMPKVVGRLFEREMYAGENLVKTHRCDFFRKVANVRYLHTWDMKRVAESHLKTLSCGFVKDQDIREIVEIMGSPYVYLNDENDWCEEVIENWIDEHGADVESRDIILKWTKKLWGINKLWENASIDWDAFKWTESTEEKNDMLENAAPEAATSYIDCFWNHEIPVEDVFA